MLKKLLITSVQILNYFFYIYTQVTNAIRFHSLLVSNKNSESQAAMAVKRAGNCGAKGPNFEPRPLPPSFGQKLEICATCENRKNSEGCHITLP